MKQEKKNERKAKSQNRISIQDAFTDQFKLYAWVSSSYEMPQVTPPLEGQGGGFTVGKGPPGRSGCLGLGRGRPPDNKAGPPRDFSLSNERMELAGNSAKKQIFNPIIKQYVNKYQNSNFYKHFNFKIMKKQFLVLSFFVLALIFAGTKSYGQPVSYVKNLTGAPTCTPAVALTCSSGADALHPIPGTTYDYTVTVNPAVAAGGSVQWFVTTSSTIIDGTTGAAPILTPSASRDKGDGTGTYILLAEAAKYDLASNLSPTIKISWKYFDGATQQVLLVAYVMDNAGCTNNVEVYRITPTFSFTLDMAALLDAGTPGSTECVSPVESATYAPGTPGNLTMNYGENWVFFSVNAANFVHSWMPAFTPTYTGTGTVPPADIQWAYPTDAIANTAWNAVTVPVLAKDATGAVGAAGECIVVRARIVHNKDQVLAATTLTLGVDGTMRNPAGAGDYTTAALKDLDNPAAAGACVNNITDQKTYTITPRPAITTTTVGVAPNTNPGPFIPKN